MHFIFALVSFFLCLGANAAASFSDIVSFLPDGGYRADLETNHNGLLNITDLDGNPVKGSPFVIDPIPFAPLVHAPDSEKTENAWGCVDGEMMDAGFWVDAGKKLAAWCNGNTLHSHTIQWFKTDDNLAYLCNYAGPQPCKGDEFWDYMHTIAGGCNHLGAGWYLQGSGDKTYGRGIQGGKSDRNAVCSGV
ncbi:hypothetical protein PG999_009175 [Apiospora kogelbergensis]|uniref:Uncharacterized protein n=1 Tax=Apiospora kogelbergensis TaxID=1337665 RepID=A0AAW0QTD4_9PEZI